MNNYQSIANEYSNSESNLILNRSLTIGGRVMGSQPFSQIHVQTVGCRGIVQTWNDGRFVIAGLPRYDQEHSYTLQIQLDNAPAVQHTLIIPKRQELQERPYDILISIDAQNEKEESGKKVADKKARRSKEK